MGQLMQHVETQPVETEDGLNEAKKNLTAWLKARQYRLVDTREWSRWTYGEIPFWSVWAEVFGSGDGFFIGELGMHIYDDGRVACASRTWSGYEE